MAPSLIACPSCACHVRASEAECPTCGAALPRSGAIPRTAAAVALGLAAMAMVPGCGDDTGGSASGSGGGGTGGDGAGGAATTSATGSTSATTAASTASSSSGGTGGEVSADYGVGPTGGGSAAD
jgi:hypothetical protein